ncbi:MAG: heavy metal translocating P-type ATPase [Oscillospiraceae bacterium]
MTEEIYDIGGMHCAACSSAVERVTRKLPGVAESSVNLPMNRLTIRYDEALCSPEAIIAKVEKAGFTAKKHQSPEESADPRKEDGAGAAKREKTELIVSVFFAALLLTVSMGPMLFPGMPFPALFSMETHPANYAFLQLLLSLPVLVLGRRFFVSGFRSLFHGNPNMDTLVALSATASFAYSLVMSFLTTDDPHAVHSLYYESAAVVVALVSVGKYLEARNKEKTKDAITGLMSLAPDTAILVDENGQWEVPANMVKVGDTVLVKPGARVPLDGVVIRGSGSVNEAMLTGESLPVEKTEGSQVIGGSVSVDGALFVRVTRVGEDTTLARIIRFVEDAQGKKAPISKTADKVAGVFVPAVMAVAVLAAAVWLMAGKEFSFALRIFTSVLVIACPCAMGLATPTAIIVGTGLGAKHGILVRSGEALETCHKTDVVIFDKTGTVTQGKPAVTDLLAVDEGALLSAALALEALSDHPLSKAVCEKAAERGFRSGEAIRDFETLSGRGLAGVDEAGAALLAGNARLMEERGVDISPWAAEQEALQNQGKTVIFVSRGGKALGLLAIADTIKPDAREAVAALEEMGVKTVLLTGDNRAAAAYIGAQAGIDEVVAQVLPTEKAQVVARYQAEGRTVMMVGDGINDAPALTQADVGCAIGSGSDIAIDSADIVLMKPTLTDVGRAIRLSRLTIRNIRQNLFWAFCYNTLGIPIAAGVLYPAFGLLLSPMIGGLAMSLSSLFVVTNALRLKGKKL